MAEERADLDRQRGLRIGRGNKVGKGQCGRTQKGAHDRSNLRRARCGLPSRRNRPASCCCSCGGVAPSLRVLVEGLER